MPKRKIIIIGSNGQLGHDLCQTSDNANNLQALTHKQIEICDHENVSKLIERLKPDCVIDLAAFHQVDFCEEQIEKAFQVNCHAVKNLAETCTRIGSEFVYISTDYVFSGINNSPRTEDNATDPINVYGMSKRAGESMVQAYCDRYYIFRVSGLYGIAGSSGKGGNFVETMIRLAKSGNPIKIVDDQVLTPTNTKELAEKIWAVLMKGQFGLYHCTNSGECSWFEFAEEIFRQMDLHPIYHRQSTKESGAVALRPKYSALDNKRLREAGIDEMSHWRLALNAYLVDKHNATPLKQ